MSALKFFAQATLVIILFTLCIPEVEARNLGMNRRVAQLDTTPEGRVNFAERLFNEGKFEESRQVLGELLAAKESLSNSQLARVYLLRSRVEYAFVGEDGLRPWLERLFEVDPSYALDPMRDPPASHRIMRELRATHSELGDDIPSSSASTSSPPVAAKPATGSSAFFWHMLPFGVGHYDEGLYIAGTGFLLSEGLSLGLGFKSYFASYKTTSSEATAPSYQINKPEQNSDAPVVVLPLERSALPMRSAFDEGIDQPSVNQPAYALQAGLVSFAGLWGYEIYQMLPYLDNLDKENAASVRHMLNFFPFGVGQIKNGQHFKATLFGLGESALLVGTLLSRSESMRVGLTSFFYLAWFGGVADAWIFEEIAKDKPEEKRVSFNYSLLPYKNSDGLGVEGQVGFHF